jgi:hypothetical protein
VTPTSEPTIRNARPASWLVDVLCSFAVYLIPLAGAHFLSFVGEYLVRSIGRRGTSHPGWVASEWLVVLIAQILFLAVLRITRRVPGLLRAAFAGVALILLIAPLNVVLLSSLPARYLIENNITPEVNSLVEECHADDVYGLPALAAVFVRAPGQGAIVVRRHGDDRFGVLNVPGCSVQDLDVPATADVVSTAGAAVLWTTRRTSSAPPAEWFVSIPGVPVRRVDGSAVPANVTPQLLHDERTLAWLEAGAPAHIALAEPAGIRRIAVPNLPQGSVGPLTGAGPQGPFYVSVLGTGVTQWLTIDGAGAIASTVRAPGIVSRFSHQLHPLADGWIAWDTYLDEGRYVLAWSRAGAVTQRELPRGLGITGVAVDAQGEFVAVTATSGLNIGRQRDEVWLVRTSDGTELFRRYAPKYSRDRVALPAGRYFVAGEITNGRPALRAYRLPE